MVAKLSGELKYLAFVHLCPSSPSNFFFITIAMAHLSSSSHAHHGAQGLPYSRPSTPGPQPLQLGFVGLGAMGYPMAKNLATSQHPHTGPHPLLVWNRSRAKSEQLQQELGKDKIRIADTPEQVAKECDVVLTSLANDAIVKSIYAQFNKALSVSRVYCIRFLHLRLL